MTPNQSPPTTNETAGEKWPQGWRDTHAEVKCDFLPCHNIILRKLELMNNSTVRSYCSVECRSRAEGTYQPKDQHPAQKSGEEFNIDWKTSDKPPRFGWAPGNYLNDCIVCKAHFVGDKRAVHCADCAYAMPDSPKSPPAEQPKGEWKWLSAQWSDLSKRYIANIWVGKEIICYVFGETKYDAEAIATRIVENENKAVATSRLFQDLTAQHAKAKTVLDSHLKLVDVERQSEIYEQNAHRWKDALLKAEKERDEWKRLYIKGGH